VRSPGFEPGITRRRFKLASGLFAVGVCLEIKRAKFHFQEIDWIIYFPNSGNNGREYVSYGVAFRNRKRNISQSGPRIYLREVINYPELRDNYPHTVSLYFSATGKGKSWQPVYVQTRKIYNPIQFFNFLHDLQV
jgi:hypothetical protein